MAFPLNPPSADTPREFRPELRPKFRKDPPPSPSLPIGVEGSKIQGDFFANGPFPFAQDAPNFQNPRRFLNAARPHPSAPPAQPLHPPTAQALLPHRVVWTRVSGAIHPWSLGAEREKLGFVLDLSPSAVRERLTAFARERQKQSLRYNGNIRGEDLAFAYFNGMVSEAVLLLERAVSRHASGSQRDETAIRDDLRQADEVCTYLLTQYHDRLPENLTSLLRNLQTILSQGGRSSPLTTLFAQLSAHLAQWVDTGPEDTSLRRWFAGLSITTAHAADPSPAAWMPVSGRMMEILATISTPSRTTPTLIERHRFDVAHSVLATAAILYGVPPIWSPVVIRLHALIDADASPPALRQETEAIASWLSILLHLHDREVPGRTNYSLETPAWEPQDLVPPDEDEAVQAHIQAQATRVKEKLPDLVQATGTTAASFEAYTQLLAEGNTTFQGATQAESEQTLEARLALLRQARTAYEDARRKLDALLPHNLPVDFRPQSSFLALSARMTAITQQVSRDLEQSRAAEVRATAAAQPPKAAEKSDPFPFIASMPRDTRRTWTPVLELAQGLWGREVWTAFSTHSFSTPHALLEAATQALGDRRAWWDEHMPFLRSMRDLSPHAQFLLLLALRAANPLPRDGETLIAALRDRLSRSGHATAVIASLSTALATMVPRARDYEVASDALFDLLTRDTPPESRELEAALAPLAAARGESRKATAEWARLHFAEAENSPVLRALTDLATRREPEVPSTSRPEGRRPAKKK